MFMELAPGSLTWAEVDPVRHPFDREAAATAVRALGPALRVPCQPESPEARLNSDWGRDVGQHWADAMSKALIDRYGRWAAGWRWSVGEADFDGGPVGAWCCPKHSVTTPEATVDTVVTALCEWRDWLETLATWFETHPLDPADIEDQYLLWESTARNLILHVADRTGAESAWYGHCHTVLTWFLSRWGVAPERAEVLVEQAIGGRFESWSGPDVPLVQDVAERLTDAIRPEFATGLDTRSSDGTEPADRMRSDHLTGWLTIRDTIPWPDLPPREFTDSTAVPNDAVAEDIRGFDGVLDPNRASGLLAALELARGDAAHDAVLNFALLQTWQRHVLGTSQPPPFREEPAFAKGGRERYGIGPDTRARLDACLAETAPAPDGPVLSLSARAARAYLDVCFFHPFADGNARAAFLALVFVLARENVSVTYTGLVRRVSFRAVDPQGAVVLTRYVNMSSAAFRPLDRQAS